MRKLVVWMLVGGIVVILLGLGALRVTAVQDGIAQRVVERRLSEQQQALFEPDALRALICGSASPLPHPSRAKACVAVFAANRFWVVDTGTGSWNTLAMLGLDASRVGAILLTHFHSDHIGDLGEFNLQTWAGGRDAPLTVYGPAGVERVVAGFNEAYALDAGYRTAHHGAALMPPEASQMRAITIEGPQKSGVPAVVFKEDGLTITAFPVQHDPVVPAYGYRFDYKGRSLVVSGDTIKSASLTAAARGVDVLIHEAQSDEMVDTIGRIATRVGRSRIATIMKDIQNYHTTPVEAAEVANEAQAKLLVMYHLNPPPPARLVERIFARGVDEVRDEGWILADDGTLITLPADSELVAVEQR